MRKPLQFTYIIGGIGAALMLGAAVLEGGIEDRDLRVFGAMILLYALARRCVAQCSRPVNAAYELGHTEGYQEGYQDGREVGRPVVVKLPIVCRKDASARGCGATASRDPSPTLLNG